MIQSIIIGFKRLAILVPGVLIAYFAFKDILPVIDKRLPFSLALFATYIITAYGLIPSAVRIYRMLKPAKHLPLYCVTPDGFASDPLNIALAGTRREVIMAMEASGWHMADKHTVKNISKMGFATLLKKTYANAPVSNLYLFGRKQDLAFQIPIKDKSGNRHHVRFWATSYEKGGKLSFHTIDWHSRKEHLKGDDLLWVGAASLDNGFGFIRHNFQVTHMIDPDTDKERELIVEGLKDKKLIGRTDSPKLGEPYKLINRVFRGSLHADGRMTIIKLKK